MSSANGVRVALEGVMQVTFLNVRYSCKPMSHNEFALACVRLHRALGHALCKGFVPDAASDRARLVLKPVLAYHRRDRRERRE